MLNYYSFLHFELLWVSVIVSFYQLFKLDLGLVLDVAAHLKQNFKWLSGSDSKGWKVELVLISYVLLVGVDVGREGSGVEFVIFFTLALPYQQS